MGWEVLGLILLEMAAEQEAALPLRTAGPWSVAVGPGETTLQGRRIRLPQAVILEVPPVEPVRVRDEFHAALPQFNEKAGSWMRGAHFRQLEAEECTATGLMVPGSVRVKPAAGESTPFVEGQDYRLDEMWANFGRIEGGALAADQPVYVDYDYVPCRIDSVVVGPTDEVKLVLGRPATVGILPPELAPGEVAVANLWLAGPLAQLTDENLFPIEPEPVRRREGPAVAETLLPRTLAKLRAGDKVTIVAWGDSVTAGGGVGQQVECWYQHRFAALLRQRFPQADITMLTAAWPGYNSRAYLDQPPGSAYDFERDVLAPRPDLVTIEFVNDAYLSEEQVQTQYAEILERLAGIGAEVILIAPHLVRPDWMGMATMKFDEDPRPYVKGLKRFAAAHRVALADVSQRWCRLWRQGIPYLTLEANWINHPDARGHELFAQALIDLFPEQR
jgi:lysophospholipase L1-like esterase